jgi:hypothetical protein
MRMYRGKRRDHIVRFRVALENRQDDKMVEGRPNPIK